MRSAKHISQSIISSGFWAKHSPKIQAGVSVENDFFGINIAPGADPMVDDFIIERLQELGLQHVRMNFTYDSLDGYAERLLKRVLDANFKVLLDLIPPFEDAKTFTMAAQQRWIDFLNTIADKYGDKVACIEIGSTPNRGRWSGFEPMDYLIAWRIANEQLKTRGIVLAGPNVSDFEPLCSIQLLSEMQLQGHAPDIYTNNLFVERVIQPEAFDHRALGKAMTSIMKLNLVKKARVMKAIGHEYGVDNIICTYKCWSSKRLRRWSVTPEQKKSDYLIRYLVIAASTGALGQVYWGPLICSRDGLINDGSTGYPVIDNVTFYKQIRGDLSGFEIREAFYAYANIIKLLAGSTCVQAVNADKGLHHFIFETKEQKQLHIVWTQDRGCVNAEQLYSREHLEQAEIMNALGEAVTESVLSFTERPLFLRFEQPTSLQQNEKQLADIQPRPEKVNFGITGEIRYLPWTEGKWHGAVAVKPGEDAKEKAQALLPEKLLSATQLSLHRDQRNKVWSIQHPLASNDTVVVKENRARGIKKITYRFKASKGQRHWDNAWEMLRRGVKSPMPVAYYEQTENTGITHNYYVCEYVDAAFSVRQAFTAFGDGQDSFGGFSKEQIIKGVADYACNMHDEKIIHHDLTGGNLLVTTENDEINITAIDIGRATIYIKQNVTEQQRLLDLMRCCYKLNWPNRELFMEYYFEAYGRQFAQRWKTSLSYYDWKLTTKKKLKRLLKGKWKKAKN
ncbi:MAG: lipopolysaccharide kinase InaA family protein [Gammaproteobacteria bacterium]|nr:lipopolysaccharide kinase InaA family protein [Gammaproteobacteria bacterium]